MIGKRARKLPILIQFTRAYNGHLVVLNYWLLLDRVIQDSANWYTIKIHTKLWVNSKTGQSTGKCARLFAERRETLHPPFPLNICVSDTSYYMGQQDLKAIKEQQARGDRESYLTTNNTLPPILA